MRNIVFLALAVLSGSAVCAAADLPTEWIDGATGHRVIRLSREDGTESLYFNQNAYTADGRKLIVTTADVAAAQIAKLVFS
jgi:oligogalacturonide lyase